MGSIIENTQQQINRNAFTNSVIYGAKALTDISQSFQKPGYIEKPIIKAPAVKAAVIDPNTRPFDQARKTMLEESAGARRVAGQTGNPALNSSIFAQTLKGIDQITSQKSAYLSDVDARNSIAVAGAFNEMSAGNANANNIATQLQLEMQTQENLLTDNANASARGSFGTSTGQLAMVGTQKSQSIVDLMYLERMLTEPIVVDDSGADKSTSININNVIGTPITPSARPKITTPVDSSIVSWPSLLNDEQGLYNSF